MHVLVTGGAGYIGSVTVERLIEQGHRATVVDNLSQGHRAALHDEAEFHELDLADADALGRTIAAARPDAVMHFASRTLVGESMTRPFLYLDENVRNGLNLLRACVGCGVQRFILSSTANLFDEPESIPITEKERIVPGSPYGESKYMLERMLYWLDRTSGLKHAALRYFNAAGATVWRGEDHDPETHLIPLVLQVAQEKREKLTIFGDDYPTRDGTCVRDYIHVSDLADAHILAMEAIGDASRVYNLGSGNGFTVREVIDTARQVTGHPIAAETGPRRSGDPAALVADSQTIRRELGWQPRFSALEDIIASAWRWHQQHPHGYQDK